MICIFASKLLKKTSILLLIFSLFYLNSCGLYRPTDARKVSPNADERVKQNQAKGKGFTLGNVGKGGGTFQFASSNPLWRASLDILDFMPITNASYSGGIIITDWYSESNSQNESIKISIRFKTNEIRSDALDIKIFNRKCLDNLFSCKITKTEGVLVTELKREILKKATIYKEQDKEKKK